MIPGFFVVVDHQGHLGIGEDVPYTPKPVQRSPFGFLVQHRIDYMLTGRIFAQSKAHRDNMGDPVLISGGQVSGAGSGQQAGLGWCKFSQIRPP